MISPRWHKVISDLFANKLRTLLVVLSIAVGVFAVGYVTTAFPLILEDMDKDFQSVNPHAAVIYCEPFRDELLETIRRMPEIGEAEGHSALTARVVNPQNNQLLAINIIAIPAKFEDMKIDRLQPDKAGDQLSLGTHEIFIERSALAGFPVKPDDTITIELVDGKRKDIKVSAMVHDVSSFPFAFSQQVTGYVTPETIEWLGGSQDYYQLYITVKENKTDEVYVTQVAKKVADKVEKGGREVYYTFVYKPGRHWASDITKALMAMMGFLGALSVFLSAFLVINTISALLNQHIRQIGMMKAIGGKTSQLIGMYLVLVMAFGLLALLIAIPISSLAAFGTAIAMSNFLNFNVMGFRLLPMAVSLQLAIAIFVPVGAAMVPVWSGTRLTIREAISSYGLGKGQWGRSTIDRAIEKIRGLPRPLLLSLRNTFRRKMRLFLTLSTLTLAGAIFIAVFNVRAAMNLTIDEALGYFLSDVNVDFNKSYRTQRLEPMVLSIPGAEKMEGWGFSSAQLLAADKKTSIAVLFIAPPSGSTLIKPSMTGGRWLLPQDENAIVIGNHLLAVRPELKVGDHVLINVKGKEIKYQIVGTYKMAGNMPTPMLYTNYEPLARIRNEVDQVASIRVVTSPHDPITQKKVANFLEAKFRMAGINVSSITTGAENSQQQAASIDVLIYLLLAMAILIAMVGGLGLMGTMGMNVLERTREIGVMRAIGASDFSIMQMVIIEGLVVGLISWIMGSLLSIPISILLDNVVGVAVMQTPMQFVFSMDGFIMWLIGITVISTVASVLPARNASHLTIREVLAYE